MNDWHDDGQAAHALELEREREEMTMVALMNCKRNGADLGDLEHLAAEMGLGQQWKQYEATTQP